MTDCQAAVVVEHGAPLAVERVPLPDLEPGGVLVQVDAATLCGTDVHFWHGLIIPADSVPYIPRHDAPLCRWLRYARPGGICPARSFYKQTGGHMSAGVVRGLVLGAVTLLMAFAPRSAEAQAIACPSGFVPVSRFWDGPPQDSLDRVDGNVDMIICLALRDDGFLVSDDRQIFAAGPRPSSDGAYNPVSVVSPLLSPFGYGALSYSSAALPYTIGDVGVRGYFRSGGNYIDPYFRTTFDRSIYTNTRYSGSYSPYSGAAGNWWNTPGRWR